MPGYKTFGGVQIGPTGGGGDSVVAKIDRDFARLLNHVIHLGRDLSAATNTALARLERADVRAKLIAFQKAHDECIAQLGECVTDLGHAPAKHGDLRSVVERGRVVMGQRRGDHGVLRAMLANEQAMRDACLDVLAHSRLPEPLRKVVQRALDLTETHLAAYRGLLEQCPAIPDAPPDEPPPIKITYE